MKTFGEYLEGVDPSNYRSAKSIAIDNAEKKKWNELKEDQQVTYGWDGFKGNPEATENYISWITTRRSV